MLNKARVLIAEDQTVIAVDLALAIQDAGGEVIGPTASVAEALDLLASANVDAAILDVELADGDCSAIVEILAIRHTPTIIQTGVDLPPGLAARFPGLIVQHKPCVPSKLVGRLESLIDQERLPPPAARRVDVS